MVVVPQLLPINREMTANEIRLNSTRVVKFMAPYNVNFENGIDDDQYGFRKRSNSNQFNNQFNDHWVGVQEFLQSLDDLIVIDKDTELFIGKSVLEIGFTTALPSTFALDCGASEITVHSFDQQAMATFVKGTIRRNGIPKTVCKYSTGGLETCLKSLGGKKFDVILAPEIINVNEESYQQIVEILNAALADHGVILLSGRTFYDDVTGSVQGFLDYCRSTPVFDGFVRWTSTKSEVNPRKLIQLTRAFR